MLNEYVPPSLLNEQLNSRDSAGQSSLRQQLSDLDVQVTERFQTQPVFHGFVQHHFDQDFAELASPLDLRHSYVQSREKTPTTSSATDDAQPLSLMPSLMDAAVQRIVSGEAASYASRQTDFYHVPKAGGATERFSALKAQAFDGFLDRLADGLLVQYPLYLQRYWDTPLSPTDNRTHKQWLEEVRLTHLKTEFELLRCDELLSPNAQTLFDKLLRYPDAAARQALPGYRPCVYGLALKQGEAPAIQMQGAFILTSRNPQDSQTGWEIDARAPAVRPIEPTANVGWVLLFSQMQGFEEFDSLASLDRELHRRLGHGVEFASLLEMIADNDHERVLALHRVAPVGDQMLYLERLDSPFTFGIESQCRLIQQNVASTIARYQAMGIHAEMANLPRALDRVTDLRRAFTIDAVLQARNKKRTQARLRAFLAGASVVDKEAWASAFTLYGQTLANLSDSEGLPSFSQFSDRRSLLAYSNRQLRVALESEHGLTVNPDDILVTTREPDVPPVTYAPGAPASTIREPGGAQRRYRSRTLTELALENVGGLDFNFSNYSTLNVKASSGATPSRITPSPNINPAAGLPTYDGLTVEQVKDLVRNLNVGQSYQDFLQANLITSTQAALHKQTFARLMAQQLRLDAIEAKINGDFLPDRLARGFNWVTVVLDHPVDNDQRAPVEDHRIIVQHLKLRGQLVRGVLLFCTSTAGSGTIVVYTPQAPDGRVFREYPREHLMRDFIHNSQWREYLVGRVELAFQPQVRASVQGRGDVSTVSLARIADNFFEVGYEIEVSFAINDAAAQTTTTGQTDIETGLTVAGIALDVVTMVLPIRVTLPIGLARSLFSLFNAVDAAKIADREGVAHHVVRALGEFAGALVDGAVGKGLAGATPKAVPRLASGARRLNPQMALGKKPQALSPLPGWEGKGIYYKLSPVDGVKQYFLNDGQHWYSILDEGFEQAWRVRDARKPVQYHYSPIRRDRAGQWEIGTHPDAPALGGFSPERALRDLYPFLDEFQARRVFESFAFPPGREIEFRLSLVHYLRTGGALGIFDTYLIVSPARFQMRLRGLDWANAWSGGGIVDPAARPIAVEPVPGPSRPRPVEPIPGPNQPVVVPSRPARPASEQFVDWGQTLDPAHVQLQDPQMGIYRRIGGDPQWIGRDYVKIDERYFPVLPSGAAINTGVVLMHDPQMPTNSFVAFERMLSTDLYRQPRLATFEQSLSRWMHSIELPFIKSLVAYVADAFPTFTSISQTQVANMLFNLGNPTGLTAWGIAALQRTLQGWRSLSAQALPMLGEPLSLLPITRKTAGAWRLETFPDLYHRLNFSTDGVPVLMHEAVVSGTERALKTLMVERLVGSRYEMVAGFNQPSELLFRRAGSDQLFWMTLRRALGEVVEGPHDVTLRVDLMEPATRTLVSQAQASNHLVQLIGGIHLPAVGAQANIFIFRI
ncbi:dermonecrotic toxin domain-containing protein [Pseudomonas sp. NPDC087626]|uniref:dermonecrotic toxin domain-containing protein n=1 Tax=Pseudomonas sp. NPDC087626 TaxID=3364444 RepID=UPI0037F1362D